MRVTASRREAHPGDTIQINVSLIGDNGREIMRQVAYQAPIGAEPGTIYFTVADAATTNLADFHQVLEFSGAHSRTGDRHVERSASEQ